MRLHRKRLSCRGRMRRLRRQAWVRSPRPARSTSWQLVESFDRAQVDVLQRLNVRPAHALVDLVDAGVERAKLDQLRADARDEAAVARAAGGGECGFDTRRRADR